MTIRLAESDAEIAGCYAVLKELRPELEQGSFVSRVRALQASGYRLAYLQDGSGTVAAAGFRLGENLPWGRFLYVDDLVTLASARSRGYGAALLAWLTEYAIASGCEQLHLDSGVWRKDAHRFYQRAGMEMTSYHFCTVLKPGK